MNGIKWFGIKTARERKPQPARVRLVIYEFILWMMAGILILTWRRRLQDWRRTNICSLLAACHLQGLLEPASGHDLSLISLLYARKEAVFMDLTNSADPRILFIDSYDSFTNNLVALCHQAVPDAKIHVIKNDQLTMPQLVKHLGEFSMMIIGPGPGSPENPGDIGIVREIWGVDQSRLIPVFGVCLGLQSLAIEHGAQLKRLRTVKHGQISLIQHAGSDLFQGVGVVQAVRYHSLHVSIPLERDLEELAFTDDGPENGKVTMAVKHKSKPFWAVQYHPESVRTSGGGIEVMQNFCRMAGLWNKAHRQPQTPWSDEATRLFGAPWPTLGSSSAQPILCYPRKRRVTTQVLHLPNLSPTTVAELASRDDDSIPAILLDSAAKPGRFSIVGFLDRSSSHITHFVGDSFVSVSEMGKSHCHSLEGSDAWQWTAAFMDARKAEGGHKDIPFWGGLVGYLSYEFSCGIFGPQRAAHPASSKKSKHPDVNLVFVERSVILDKAEGMVYVQSIIPKDEFWVKQTARLLRDCPSPPAKPVQDHCLLGTGAKVNFPDHERYISRIKKAKDHLFAGNSYELCLTAQTRVDVPKDSTAGRSSWQMYKCLRKHNPAPHSAYLRLHPTTVLSSSPERFLSFSRPPHSVCQLRPIKGTLRKAPGITRAEAERGLAGNVKEVAENLMIVDLIRHDLHGIVGKSVEVTQFCGIEEYETVWQMVSVVEGNPTAESSARGYPDTQKSSHRVDFGWNVLRECLPPGSMTGAPKKRSVEILCDLEDGPRGIYSGVLGYWDVGGGGDWAVVIRSCFKFDEPSMNTSEAVSSQDDHSEQWTLGAGGAITALSDPQAEWEEMVLKLQSVLRIFG